MDGYISARELYPSPLPRPAWPTLPAGTRLLSFDYGEIEYAGTPENRMAPEHGRKWQVYGRFCQGFSMPAEHAQRLQERRKRRAAGCGPATARERSTDAAWYELAKEGGGEAAEHMVQSMTNSYSALEHHMLNTLRNQVMQQATIMELAQATALPPCTVRMGLQWLLACGSSSMLGRSTGSRGSGLRWLAAFALPGPACRCERVGGLRTTSVSSSLPGGQRVAAVL